MSSSSISNFGPPESSSSKDFPAYEANWLKENKPTSPADSVLSSAAPISRPETPNLSNIPTVCIGIITSFAGSIAPMQTCRQLKKLENPIYQQLIIDFEKELKPLELNKLKEDARFTRDGYSAKVKLYKISNCVKAQMENLPGGSTFLRNEGLLPVISASQYRETQKWIQDENFLKFCTRLPFGANSLGTLNMLSHAEKAESMRMWINENGAVLENRTEELNLSELGLTELPPEICKFINLRHLNLNDNHLTTLPPEIGQLINLMYLELSDNRLATLPPEIGQLGNLRGLYMSGNRLETLPPEIGQLGNLRGPYLSDNRLATLPPQIGQLVNLDSLQLRGNPLKSLPMLLTNMFCRKNITNLPRKRLFLLGYGKKIAGTVVLAASLITARFLRSRG